MADSDPTRAYIRRCRAHLSSALGLPHLIATGRGSAWASVEGSIRGHPGNANEEFSTLSPSYEHPGSLSSDSPPELAWHYPLALSEFVLTSQDLLRKL